MNNIKAILVDDEQKAINSLSILLEDFCKNVSIVGTARSVDMAVPLIESKKPDLVFLDIEMSKKSGFELFKETKQNFQTIFVTAYNEYAVKAFEVSAIDYLLKPIHIERLQNAVKKVSKQLENKNLHIETLQKNLSEKTIKQIHIPYKNIYKILDTENIMAINAQNAYSEIYYQEKNTIIKFLYSKNLSYFESLFDEDTRFFRTHRSWMVNLNFVKSFSKINYTAQLTNDITAKITQKKMSEFEKSFLKNR